MLILRILKYIPPADELAESGLSVEAATDAWVECAMGYLGGGTDAFASSNSTTLARCSGSVP